MSKLVSLVIQENTKTLPHLYSSTADFIRKIQSVAVEPGDKLVRLDVDDFYMQGKHDLLVQKSFCTQNGPARRWLEEALDFLLSNQYVRSNDLGATFRVNCGSGMESQASGQVSDVVFYELCEKSWACERSVQKKYHVRCWLRYRDDIMLVIGGTSATRKDLVETCRQKVGECWKLKIEDLSTHSVSMLDVTVFKREDS